MQMRSVFIPVASSRKVWASRSTPSPARTNDSRSPPAGRTGIVPGVTPGAPDLDGVHTGARPSQNVLRPGCVVACRHASWQSGPRGANPHRGAQSSAPSSRASRSSTPAWPSRRPAAGRPTREEDAELAQKLGQLQPFIAAFPQECMGQLASFGPT